MRNKMLRFISLMLLVALLCGLCLVSCSVPDNTDKGGEVTPGGEGNNGDDNGNDGSDNAKNDPTRLFLTKDGVVNFSLVYNSDPSVFVDPLKDLMYEIRDRFDEAGVWVYTRPDYNKNYVQDCEVLIGTFNNREDYFISKYTLGNAGYTIRVVDNKVIILGGTVESLCVALDVFINDYLHLRDESTDLKNVSLDRGLNLTVKEQYDIKMISINGNELTAGQYAIVCDTENEYALRSAEILRTAMYNSAGYYLPIVGSSDGNAIYVTISDDEELNGFRSTVDGNNLVIECKYDLLFEGQMAAFAEEYFTTGIDGAIDFTSDFTASVKLDRIYYSDFGAIGDGIADDFEAIKATHEYANLTGQTVVADPGMTYNMGQHAETIYIKTDVIWTDASFIIDDSNIAPDAPARTVYVFTVASKHDSVNLTSRIPSLSKDATSIGFELGNDYLVVLVNSNVKQYIRYGPNADSGSNQQEIILVHADGSIDKDTPLLWDYSAVTSAIAYPAYDEQLTITGGTFTTIANQAPRQYTYYYRGINITRSNVTVKGITHLIEGEGESGAPYSAFLGTSKCNNVLFDSIVYSGHRTYRLEGTTTGMGSYDIAPASSNSVKWFNCTMATDITDPNKWGVMGSNYCKNLTYDTCTLSRFDAHMGMYNATIINSTIGQHGINAIGAGTLRIENTVLDSTRNYVVNLRDDYGSTWDGDVIIKDVHAKNTSSTFTIFNGKWIDHYFGYTCYLPQNITIDNLTLDTPATVYVFGNFGGNNVNIADNASNNPMVMPASITVTNNSEKYTYYVSNNSYIKDSVYIEKK